MKGKRLVKSQSINPSVNIPKSFSHKTVQDAVDHQNKDLAVYRLMKISTKMIPCDLKSIA